MAEFRCIRIIVPDRLPAGMHAVADELAGMLGGRIERADAAPFGVQVELRAEPGGPRSATTYLACYTRQDFFEGQPARDWLGQHIAYLTHRGHSIRTCEAVIS